jgi:molecular chaperone HscB
MCWHCQSEINGEYFCEKCVKVQPLSKELDYFTCLGLPRRLRIDLPALEAKFYELSRAFHPDFYQNTSESEQSISLGNAALLNTAYHTLRDPIQRAEYLLHLEAGSAKDIRTAPPGDLFEEILELQENLEEFRSLLPDAAPDKLARLRARLEAERENLERRQQEMDGKLNELFARWDVLQARADPTKDLTPSKQAVLKDMRDLLSHRTYLRNILDDLVTTLEAEKGHETHESHRRH